MPNSTPLPQQQLQELFQAFDLSGREQAVFEALLGRGFQPASRLAKSLSLARNTTRYVLDRLVDVGLVSRTKRANSHLYRVETPQALERSLTERHRQSEAKLKQRIKALHTIQPLFENVGRASKKPTVQFYDGYEGIERVYDDTLSAKETIRAWASFDANSKGLPDYFRSYYRRRASKGIAIRSLHPDSRFARERMKRNRAERRKCVLVPESRFTIGPEIQVYDNKINLVSWEDKIGVLIESEELAKALKNIFELCYSLAEDRF